MYKNTGLEVTNRVKFSFKMKTKVPNRGLVTFDRTVKWPIQQTFRHELNIIANP